MKYKYFAQAMHLHSCYQPEASMEGHFVHARDLNMKYIWFTDHDWRMGRKEEEIEVDKFDFEASQLEVVRPTGQKHGFAASSGTMVETATGTAAGREAGANGCSVISSRGVSLTTEDSYSGKQCMKLWLQGTKECWENQEVSLYSDRKGHVASLLSGVILQLAYKIRCSHWENARLILDIQLSQRPPENTFAHLLYVAGNAEGLEAAPHTLVIPIEQAGFWTRREFDLSSQVQTEEAECRKLGGLDNVFDTISIRVEARRGATITAWVDDFERRRLREAQETFELQREVAAEIGRKYGVTPFIGTEITDAGHHKNCFGEDIKILPYAERAFQITHEEACEWMRQRGYLFALNHIFERYNRKSPEQLDKDAETLAVASECLENHCWGATLIEVGFPYGRCFSLEYYLRLWDMLSLKGQFLTGYGSSDSHSNNPVTWYSRNNFVNWLGVAEGKTPELRDFLEAMKCGSVYTGDPVRIGGQVAFETMEGVPMGMVIEMEECSFREVVFEWNDIEDKVQKEMQKGWYLRWIVNGEIVRQQHLDAVIQSGDFDEGQAAEGTSRLALRFTLQPERLINLVRVEIYDESERCVLLTNPIYFYRKDLGELEIPAERRSR